MQGNVLKLTGIVDMLGPRRFMGRIKEISGIISHGETEDEAYENLNEVTRHMLDEYKREEALKLLAEQSAQPKVDVSKELEFSVTKPVGNS